MDLRFEHFNASVNLKQQRDLFKDSFPETNGDSIQENQHYYWKFNSFPTSAQRSWEYASYIKEDMVGYYAALPYRYKIMDKKVTIGMVCDVMTNSNYRGKGIFTKMGMYSTNELAKYVPFSTGYPIRKEVIPGHLKVGWKIAFEMPLYIKFLKSNSLFKTKHISFLSFFANAFLSVYNILVHSSINKKYVCSFFTSIEKISGYDGLIKEWLKTVPNALVKDLSFAKWRYGAPNRNYSFLAVRKEDKLVAFVACRKVVKEGIPSLALIDFICLPEFENCIGAINKALVDYAKTGKIEAIITMMSRSSSARYKLLANGFLKSPFLFSFIIKNLTNEFKDDILLNEKNWHLMWVDSDDL